MPTRDPKLLPQATLLIAVMAVLAGLHEIVNPWLRYDREAVLAGQLWRLWTCHLVHSNLWHFLLNATALVLILLLFRDLLDRLRFWLWLGLCGPGVSLALVILDARLDWYVGLSGLIQALLVMSLLLGWRCHPRLHSLILAVVIAKLIREQWPGYDITYLAAWIQVPVHVNAHLYGAIAGAVLALMISLAEKKR